MRRGGLRWAMGESQQPSLSRVPVDAVELARAQANVLGLDYRDEARKLGRPVCPIIDAHIHINGPRAAEILCEVADLYGVERFYSQTPMARAAEVRSVLGDRVQFVAIPEYGSNDPGYALGEGFASSLGRWRDEFGARCFKLWGAPRIRDYAAKAGVSLDDIGWLDGRSRRLVADEASRLGMMMMVHVADPDTWFATVYADAEKYGSKRAHYPPLERMLADYGVPCLGAHMAGSPEDLEFLAGLLDRHPNLFVDTSATKWMVRELSKHSRSGLVEFLDRFAGRVLFGSDIVASDEHLVPAASDRFGAALASSAADAFDLYASRYWAYRVMLETDYDGPSNIADPDLMKVDPEHHDALSSPRLVGRSLDEARLRMLYREAATKTMDRGYGRA